MAVGKGTYRMIGVAANDQGGPYLGLAHRALQEIARLGKARETPDGDVWHGLETGVPQPGAGRDDVVMRDTPGVINEYGRAGIEQLAQPPSGQIVTRRDLDRASGDQFR